MLTSWFVHSFQPNLHQSSAKGKGSNSIREAELDLTRPAPKVSYPPPPSTPSLQQDPGVSSESLMGMVLKRYEEIVEALLLDRFHLRGFHNLVKSPKSPLTDNNNLARPAPSGHYPPAPQTPLARPAPRGGYPPAPRTPLADVYQQQYIQAKVNGLENM